MTVIYGAAVYAAVCCCIALCARQARGCPLRSVLSVPSPASQEARLLASGWAAAAAADMAAVYHGRSRSGSSSSSSSSGGAAAEGSGWLRPGWVAERGRIERLELLDELEEWQLMQVGPEMHICLVTPGMQCSVRLQAWVFSSGATAAGQRPCSCLTTVKICG
jgi:hypothetical protein